MDLSAIAEDSRREEVRPSDRQERSLQDGKDGKRIAQVAIFLESNCLTHYIYKARGKRPAQNAIINSRRRRCKSLTH